MVFEQFREEPYKIVFQEQDTIQLRTKEGKTLTFAVDSQTSRDPFVESAITENMVTRYFIAKMMPVMFIPSLGAESESGGKADNDDISKEESLENLAKIAGVSEREYRAAARFAQQKLYDGFRERAQQRKNERAS